MTNTRSRNRMTRIAGVLACTAAILLAAAPSALAQGKKIKVTIRPLLVQAPIFGASVDLPRLPSAPGTPGGGDDGSEVSGSTDVSLNAAYMAGFELQADRWFAEVNGLWADLSANRTTPRVNIATNTNLFNARGGVRLFGGVGATVGVRYVKVDIDATLDLPAVGKSIHGTTTRTLWDPLIGLDWRQDAGGHLTFGANVQGGGFGVGTDVDVSSQATVDWRVAGPFTIRVGYGLQYYKMTLADVSIGSFQRTLVSKQTLHGPTIGIGFVF